MRRPPCPPDRAEPRGARLTCASPSGERGFIWRWRMHVRQDEIDRTCRTARGRRSDGDGAGADVRRGRTTWARPAQGVDEPDDYHHAGGNRGGVRGSAGRPQRQGQLSALPGLGEEASRASSTGSPRGRCRCRSRAWSVRSNSSCSEASMTEGAFELVSPYEPRQQFDAAAPARAALGDRGRAPARGQDGRLRQRADRGAITARSSVRASPISRRS